MCVCVCVCVSILPSCVGTVGVNNWDETLASVPATIVALVRVRSNGASAISFWRIYGSGVA